MGLISRVSSRTYRLFIFIMSTEYNSVVKGKLKCQDSQLAKVYKQEKKAKKAAKEAKKLKKEQKKLQEKIDKANEKKNFKKLRKLEKEMEQLKNEAAINGTILSQDSTNSTKSAEEDPYRFMTAAQKKQALIEDQKNIDK